MSVHGIGRLLLLLVFLLPPAAAAGGEYREVSQGDRVELPADLFFRDAFRIQWWYFTGHLRDSGGREYGYEATFFVAGVQKRRFKSAFRVNDIYISHLAVTDVAGGNYRYAESSDSGAYGFASADAARLGVRVGRSVLTGGPGRMRLQAEDDGFGLDLDLVAERPVVLHGDRGYSRKAEESTLNASLYFSYTRMKTTGRLRIGDAVFSVEGTSWFDRELSSRGLAASQSGWDWFAIQLDDGRDIMLYHLRKRDGSIDRYSSGTVVNKDGSYHRLAASDFTISVRDTYRSKKSGARYPSLWDVNVPSEGLSLRVAPRLTDQEFIGIASTGSNYWEGACAVSGSVSGRAYVEMTGY